MRRIAALLFLISGLCLCTSCRHAGQEEVLQLAPIATPSAEQEAPSPSPNPIPTLLKQAEESITRGEYKGAEAFYQQAIAWDPLAIDAYLAYASCRLLQEDPLSALSILEGGVLALGGSGVFTSLPLRERWWNILLDMRQEGTGRIDRRELARLAELAYCAAGRCVTSPQEYTKSELLLAPYMYLNSADHYKYNPDAATAAKMYAYRSGIAYPPAEVLESEEGAYAVFTPEQALQFIDGAYVVPLSDPQAEYTRNADGTSMQKVSPQYFCDGSRYYFALAGYINTAYFVESATYLGHDLYYITFGQDWLSTPTNFDIPGVVPEALHLLVQRTESGWGFSIRAVIRHGESTLLEPGWAAMPIDIPVEEAPSSYPSLRTPAQRAADLPAYEAAKQDGEEEEA